MNEKFDLNNLTDEQIDELADQIAEAGGRVWALSQLARMEFSPRGYAAFYEVIHGNEPPVHIKDIIEVIFNAKEVDKSALVFAFRGSWKTSSVTITMTAFVMGHFPERANLVVQVNDKAAQDSTAAIADIIDRNAGWKMVFPHVVPDKEKGWGAEGYEIKNTEYSADEWSRLNSARRDPSLVGYGYKSGSIIGRHPDGVLAIDDIHNEENTTSLREMDKVIKTVTGTIFPTRVRHEDESMKTMSYFVGTPWKEDDVYHYVRDTDEFLHVKFPVMDRAAPGEKDAVFFSEDELGKLSGWYKFRWPEKFGKKSAISEYKLSGQKEFARMFLLNLLFADDEGMKFFDFPSEYIDTQAWDGAGGCDYASIIDVAQKESRSRNLFALAYVFRTPQNQIVVYDGVAERCTQAEAESHLKYPQALFPKWRKIIFEADGKGEEALHTFLRNPGLRIFPDTTKGVNKRYRLEKIMGPWLENGTVRISDADTPFLNQLRRELKKFPHGGLDCLDALFWAIRNFPECLVVQTSDEISGTIKKKKRSKSPYASLCIASQR